MLSDTQLLTGALIIISSGGGFLLTWAFKKINDVSDKQLILETQFNSYKVEMERRLEERKAENDRRFNERRDERLHEQVLFEMQLKGLSEKYDGQNAFVKEELKKIDTSVNALHRRIDEVLTARQS